MDPILRDHILRGRMNFPLKVLFSIAKLQMARFMSDQITPRPDR